MQHGFAPKRSCLTNLLLTEEWFTRVIDEGDAADIMFLNFSKVLDSVNHRFLLHKLVAYGTDGLKCSFGIKVSGWQGMDAFLNPGVLNVGSHKALFSDLYFSLFM